MIGIPIVFVDVLGAAIIAGVVGFVIGRTWQSWIDDDDFAQAPPSDTWDRPLIRVHGQRADPIDPNDLDADLFDWSQSDPTLKGDWI